ncbi:MAG: hypothetical protein AB8I08_07705 [Sandaracinaceae bacterium]
MMRPTLFAAMLLAALASGCDPAGESCSSDAVCSTSSGGRCVADRCQYPDAACASGSSFAPGECVPAAEDAGGRDAGTRDAGSLDAGTQDAGSTDAGSTDGGSDAGPGDGPLKAFPSAFGGGATATGGRGGVLILVNTDDPEVPLTHFEATATTPERYEGGFYAALQHDGAAYIVFDRSMNIDLGVRGTGRVFGFSGIPGVTDKTIFGQSAPEGGVTITGGTFRFDGQSEDLGNLIFRYLRSRPVFNSDGVRSDEDDSYTWGLLLYGGDDIMIDHCSFSFANDKAVGGFIDQNHVPRGRGMEGITFSRNLIAHSHTGAYVEINPGRPDEPEAWVGDISFLANVIAGVNRTPNLAFDGYGEVMNNVVYGNNYKSTTVYHDIQLNHVANYHFRPSGGTTSGFNRLFQHDSSNPRVFADLNYYPGLLTGVAGEDNRAVWKERDNYDMTAPAAFFADTAFDPGFMHPYAPLGAVAAHGSIVMDGDVGAARYLDDEGRPQTYQDSFDRGLLDDMIAGDAIDSHNSALWILPELPVSIRPGSYDTDLDGLADAWELRTFGDLSESYAGDADGDGYTNIEEYMNQVD